ncbi:hypothetical protein D6U52_17285 [Vibrio cholerae]|nr:hypothetical protein [Vibrio cholerae]
MGNRMPKKDVWKLFLLVIAIVAVFIGVVFASFNITNYINESNRSPLCSEAKQGEQCRIEFKANVRGKYAV